MKIQDICPVLYNRYYFKYVNQERRYRKVSFEKTQYVYRFLFVDKGCLDVCVGNKQEQMKAGDLLYLVPGEGYRLLPCDHDFSLYQLSFDFCSNRDDNPNRSKRSLLLSEYDSALALPRIQFENAQILNQSGVFKNIEAGKKIEALFRVDSENEYDLFYGRSAIFSIIADILTVATKKNNVTEQILGYIRQNPDKNLSGTVLSERFSYHKNYINKIVKQETGKNLGSYIRHIKMEYAKGLLLHGEYSPTEVAAELGYYDYSHFFKAFVAETGVAPTKYSGKG